jgi:hypothetical protein
MVLSPERKPRVLYYNSDQHCGFAPVHALKNTFISLQVAKLISIVRNSVGLWSKVRGHACHDFMCSAISALHC